MAPPIPPIQRHPRPTRGFRRQRRQYLFHVSGKRRSTLGYQKTSGVFQFVTIQRPQLPVGEHHHGSRQRPAQLPAIRRWSIQGSNLLKPRSRHDSHRRPNQQPPRNLLKGSIAHPINHGLNLIGAEFAPACLESWGD